MKNMLNVSDVENIELLTYDKLTATQQDQVQSIADALNSNQPDKLLEILKKHYYFFVNIQEREGDILHYAIK